MGGGAKGEDEEIMEEKIKRLVTSIKQDDVAEFSENFDKTTASACAGRFPLLSLCYLYDSRKILKKYEGELLGVSRYTVFDEDRESFAAFRVKAGRALRLYLHLTDVVTPLEMLAVLGKHEYLAEVYAKGYKDEKSRANIEYIVKTLYDSPLEFGRNEVIIHNKKMSSAQKKTVWIACVVSVVFCVMAVLGLFAGLKAGRGTEESPVFITNENQLALALQGTGYYKLKNDITWTQEGRENFAGTLDGNGHTLTYAATGKPLAATLSGTVKNLKIITRFSVRTEENYSVLFGENQGTIDNVQVEADGDFTVVQRTYCSEQKTDGNTLSCDCNVFRKAETGSLVQKTSGEITSTIASTCDNVARYFTYLISLYAGSEEPQQWTLTSGNNIAAYYSYFFSYVKSLLTSNLLGNETDCVISKSAVVGLNKALTVASSEKDYGESLAQVAEIFGFANTETFRSDVQKAAELLLQNAAGATVNAVADRLPYGGAIYTASGYYVLPYVVTSEDDVLLACVLVGSKGAYIWVHDTDVLAAMQGKSKTLEGRCSLYESKTVYLSVLTYKNAGTIQGCEAKVDLSAVNTKTQNSFLSVYGAWNEGTIQNCKISEGSKILSDTVDVGAFVAVNGNREKEGTISDCSVSGTIRQKTEREDWNPNIGGMVAYNYGTIKSCSVDANIEAENSSESEEHTPVVYVGGLVCQNYGTVEENSFTGTAVGKVPYQGILGGIVGLNLYGNDYFDETQSVQYVGAVDRCSTAAALQAVSAAGELYVGGISGYNTAYVRECTAEGSVIGEGTCYFGGLVGVNKGIIGDGASQCDVTATAAACVGGICGYNNYYVYGCTSAGTVKAGEESSVGGVIGVHVNASGSTVAENCYSECALQGGKNSYQGGIVAQNNIGVIKSCFSACSYGVGDGQCNGYIIGLTDATSLAYTLNGFGYFQNNGYVSVTDVSYAIAKVSTSEAITDPETTLNVQSTAYATKEEMKNSEAYKKAMEAKAE